MALIYHSIKLQRQNVEVIIELGIFFADTIYYWYSLNISRVLGSNASEKYMNNSVATRFFERIPSMTNG